MVLVVGSLRSVLIVSAATAMSFGSSDLYRTFTDGMPREITYVVTGSEDAPGQGAYMPVGRMNDPFVFCSEGMPMHGWVAVNPVSGTWTPISQYVNYQWIPTYVGIHW